MIKMKTFRDYLQEAEDKKKKTQTKGKEADSSLDDLFKPKADQSLANTEPEKSDDEKPAADNSDRRKRASQSDTLRAAGNITPTDSMRDMLSRIRDIEADDEDTGYPDPEPPEDLPSTQVNTQNLPAVAAQSLQAAGVQDPNFHKVANLPGNMARAIRTLGRQLFRSFTQTNTDDIWMVGNLNGQGPNSRSEVNAVAGWVRDTGERITQGNIDFDTTIPGYTADIQQWSASGIRWLLVRDEFGDYIYSWPESDSVTTNNNDRLAGPDNSQLRRIGR
jgi:hypothetical protein